MPLPQPLLYLALFVSLSLFVRQDVWGYRHMPTYLAFLPTLLLELVLAANMESMCSRGLNNEDIHYPVRSQHRADGTDNSSISSFLLWHQ